MALGYVGLGGGERGVVGSGMLVDTTAIAGGVVNFSPTLTATLATLAYVRERAQLRQGLLR